MVSLADPDIFNNPKVLIEGWYWLLRADDIKRGKVKSVDLQGKQLVVFRGEDGKVGVLDAHCPHMGAHLGEGKVEGHSIRCMFHNWKLDREGNVTDIPCMQSLPEAPPKIRNWPVQEAYGLIWVYSGAVPKGPIPFVPELEGKEVAVKFGNQFVKDCHPSVMMINAIDERHFASVHPMAGGLASDLNFAISSPAPQNIRFENQNRVPRVHWITRLLSKLYRGPLTYKMSYWYGSTGSVTLGPDRQHFHIIFALRPTPDGKSEGQTLLVTEKRKSLFGRLFLTPILLWLTNVVGRYFADGDTQIFRSIRFGVRFPVESDRPVVQFIAHTEKQQLATWNSEHPVKVERTAQKSLDPKPDRKGAIAFPTDSYDREVAQDGTL